MAARFAGEIFVRVVSGKAIKKDAVFQHFCPAITHRPAEQSLRLFRLTAGDEDAGETNDCLGVAGRLFEYAAEGGFSPRITCAGQVGGLLCRFFHRSWHEGGEECSHLRLGLGAGKLADDLAVAKRLYRRDALDPVLGRDPGVLIGVELGKDHVVAVFGSDMLDDRPEHPAGSAPWRPEIDHDRHALRAFEHGCGEGGIRNVDGNGLWAGHDGRLLARVRRCSCILILQR